MFRAVGQPLYPMIGGWHTLFHPIEVWTVKQAGMENELGALTGGSDLRIGEKTIETTRESQEILKVLVESKETGKAVGISSPLMGEGFVTTAVEDIILIEGETIISFKPFDSTGFMLPVSKLRLGQITAVCPLRSEFKNPVLKNLSRDNKWFF